MMKKMSMRCLNQYEVAIAEHPTVQGLADPEAVILT